MKFYKRLNHYKASNVILDLNELNAYSYEHWMFLTQVNTKLIFNSSTYSVSTTRHQTKVMRVLDKLGIKVDLMLYNTLCSLDDPSRAIHAEIKELQEKIVNLEINLTQPRIWKKTKENVSNQIEHIKLRIERLKKFHLNNIGPLLLSDWE